MANTSPQREKILLEAFVKAGGRDRRSRFQQVFCADHKWPEDVFSAVLGALVRKGEIIQRRGGRSLELPASPTVIPATSNGKAAPVASYGSERELYDPIFTAVKDKWAVERGYDRFVCEPSHSKGSAPTGGKFSRPDVTLVGVKAYVHLPGRYFEVVTFEVKASYDVNVLGVLEALAHREAAHRSYALYHVDSETFDVTENSDRIESLAEKHGIGLILAADPADLSTWEFRVEAKRNEPDPERLDAFIGGLREKSNRDEILKWNKI